MVIFALPSFHRGQTTLHKAALIAALVGLPASATANVVTDWDSKAVALAGPGLRGVFGVSSRHRGR